MFIKIVCAESLLLFNEKIALASVEKRKLVEDKVFCCQVTNVVLLFSCARALKYLGITFA